MKAFNPENVVKPASNYVQAVVHNAAAKRVVVSGQLGLSADGKLAQGLEQQMRQAWSNVFDVLNASGFEKQDLIRAVIYVTVPGSVKVYRQVRDEMLEGHLCANTYLEISALAAPEFLVEIEAEAIQE